MNDEMDDFTARPGVPNCWPCPGRGQRGRAGKGGMSMSPTLVTDGQGRVVPVGGAGPRIITGTFQTLLAVIDAGLSVEDAVGFPDCIINGFRREFLRRMASALPVLRRSTRAAGRPWTAPSCGSRRRLRPGDRHLVGGADPGAGAATRSWRIRSARERSPAPSCSLSPRFPRIRGRLAASRRDRRLSHWWNRWALRSMRNE